MADNLWLHPESKLYYVKIMIDGVRRTFPTGTRSKIKAKKEAEAIRTDLRRGKSGFASVEKKITLREMIDKYLEWCEVNHRSYGSDKAYASNALNFFDPGLHIQKISTIEIEKYKRARSKKVKPATVNHDVAFLKEMYNKANEWKITQHNPVREVRMLRTDNQRCRYLVGDERDRLLQACSSSDAPWYLGPLVQIALNTGMRRGEILNLKWRDVDVEHKVVRVMKSKSGKPRDIPMNVILVNLFNSMDKSGETVFEIQGFKRSWASVKKRSGIDDLTFHDLRHDFASQLVMKGVHLITVQQLCGHANIKTTMRYAHLAPEFNQQAVERLVDLQRKFATHDTQQVVQLRKID